LEINGHLSDEEIGSKCGELMKEVWQCSEKVMKRIEGERDAALGAGKWVQGESSRHTGEGGRLV
jgi:hypothetical protein